MDEKKENYRAAECCATCKYAEKSMMIVVFHPREKPSCEMSKKEVSVFGVCDSYKQVNE